MNSKRQPPPPQSIGAWFGVAWLVATPIAIIALWFVANQIGCQ